MTTTEEILERARTIATEIIAPNTDAWDRDARWPEAAMRALQQSGLGGLVVPAAHGGLGGGLYQLARACEVLGEADASVAICFGMHCVGTACIAAKAGESEVERFLRPIANGEHLTTLALSEPGSGSHFYLPSARMQVLDEDAYAVTGTKCFVTNGAHADSYVVSTSLDGDAAPGHFSMILVPGDSANLTWGEPWQGWGMRANSSLSLDLDHTPVPRRNRLGEEGDQIWYVFHVVAPYFLVAMTGTYLGVATRAVAEAIGHLGSRRYQHSGRTLAEIDVLQHRLGTLWSELQRTRRLCYWAAEEADAGGADDLPALCAAKAEVGDAVVHLVNECMTLLGGIAFRDGSVLQRLLRDARAAHVMAPTTDVLRTWIGRILLGLPLLGE